MVRKLLSLNGLAILSAVLYHAAGWGFISMFWWADRYRSVAAPNFDMLDSFTYLSLRSIEQLIIFAIPVFLFVSGYFIVFASGKDDAPRWSWVFTRIKFLVIPYLLWSIIMIVLNTFLGETYSPGQIINTLLTGKAVEAFYFIPLLVQFYLLAPLLTPLARKTPATLLVVTFIIMVLIRFGQFASLLGINYPLKQQFSYLLPSWLFPGNLFWLVLGLTIGYHYKTITEKLHQWRWFLLATVILLIPLGIWEWELLFRLSGQQWIPSRETLLDNFYSFLLILSFLTFPIKKMSKQKWLNELGSKSFAIYLTHSLFLTLTAKSIYHLVPAVIKYQIIFQVLLIFAAIAGPLILIEVVKRTWFNRFYVYILG